MTRDATVTVLCGSTKFKSEFMKVAQRLTLSGHVVLNLSLFGRVDLPYYDWVEDRENLKPMLDDLHRQKIRMSDEVYVVNPDGYIGESTRSEIMYAESLGLLIRYMDDENS